MEARRKHPQKALTQVRINSLSKPGRYGDGNGLYLVVDESGAKRWVLRTVVHGKRRDMGLGSLRLVTLAEARIKAVEYRKLARDGGDPIAANRSAKVGVPTFADAARSTLEQRRAGWKDGKSASQWLKSLSAYVFPVMGDKRVDRIETSDVLRALSPIWLSKPETSRRIRQRIAIVLDWAKAAGHRSGDNPVEGVGKGLPRQNERRGHFNAIPYADVPEFVRKLPEFPTNDFARLALEFLILTAARTNEVLRAEWSEVDFERSVWTIPGARMKVGRDHRVPLASRSVSLLQSAREKTNGSQLIFPGRTTGMPMSNMVFLMMLRRMGASFTAHGFRSAFRDWAAECTNFPREVCEMALAHSIKDKTEAAYRRGDLFVKRVELMREWAEYAGGHT
ncbi:tyrosine-type recombinase/integrase [Bradyrhizobium sp. 24]|uniref:tyrosine-type recombinase/integrase n=1 Tax=unclassified Bradyrhizobium TaxID=2631580 RepID=UPI001FFAE9F6|nr:MULTISPECIES: site-specific integrase [unclassified Bradyrhizobium]MCK1297528.1 tyrosine-type recombinase/integrase [Bradyrhizobium sp. 37]MCK1381181.1 tyrosine-type recombinase/integrase [Bradyrhizobium sp. 24]MCK1770932.1 tyrosine-type recombinase/integrase [Bradyrhizobium sp. 134]